MIVPIFPRARGGISALSEWIKGRNAQAREREDRETAHTIALDLERNGGIWADRDGQRTRVIIRLVSGGATTVGTQWAQIEPLLELEQGDGVDS